MQRHRCRSWRTTTATTSTRAGAGARCRRTDRNLHAREFHALLQQRDGLLKLPLQLQHARLDNVEQGRAADLKVVAQRTLQRLVGPPDVVLVQRDLREEQVHFAARAVHAKALNTRAHTHTHTVR